MKNSSHSRAFSLVELMVVMAIVAVLATLSVSIVGGAFKSSRLTASITRMSGLMEQARQHAIANNTYVWVVFQDETSLTEPMTSVLVMESKSGVDALGWNSSPVSLAEHPEFQVLGPVAKLEGVRLVDSGQVTVPGAPTAAALPATTVDLRYPAEGGAIAFNRAIQFAPTGEGRVQATGRLIEIGFTPYEPAVEQTNVGLIRVTRTTGKQRIYRVQ